MSEQLPTNQEHGEALLPTGEIEKLIEASTERSPAEIAAEATAQEAAVESARTTAEAIEQTNPLENLQANEAAAADQAPIAPPNDFLKKQNAQQGLKAVQAKESKPARALSKVVHQPAVRATSEVAAQTVTRPSGLLGGGIAAFVGGSVYVYLAYHIGFVYQPTVFLALLLAGFIVGIALEFVVRLVARPSR